jgi:outer membrane receptor for ferric coprogen and ferric-rhodotorulic acid
MHSELHNLNLKLCSKQYNKIFVLHLIVSPQLSSDWQHNYSTKTRQAGWANEQSMYSLMSMIKVYLNVKFHTLTLQFNTLGTKNYVQMLINDNLSPTK